ncbi:hypothetical protein N2152v2_007052 [Parachlorella kessleri]
MQGDPQAWASQIALGRALAQSKEVCRATTQTLQHARNPAAAAAVAAAMVAAVAGAGSSVPAPVVVVPAPAPVVAPAVIVVKKKPAPPPLPTCTGPVYESCCLAVYPKITYAKGKPVVPATCDVLILVQVDKTKSVPVTKEYGLVAYPPLTWKLTTPGFPVEVCACPPPPPKKIIVVSKNKPAVKVVSVPLEKPVAVSSSALAAASAHAG